MQHSASFSAAVLSAALLSSLQASALRLRPAPVPARAAPAVPAARLRAPGLLSRLARMCAPRLVAPHRPWWVQEWCCIGGLSNGVSDRTWLKNVLVWLLLLLLY